MFQSACPRPTVVMTHRVDGQADSWKVISYETEHCGPKRAFSSNGTALFIKYNSDLTRAQIKNERAQSAWFEFQSDLRSPDKIDLETVGEFEIAYDQSGEPIRAREKDPEFNKKKTILLFLLEVRGLLEREY